MTNTKDLNNWTAPTMVLQEPFHLSFPFVFKHGDEIYIIPESSEIGEIRIYRFCDDSLTQVEFMKVLKEGEYVDSSIISKDGKYYLFTSASQFNQRVFVSEDLLGDYNEHPSSPIYSGSDFGRNGGSVFKYKGTYYRPSQDCTHLNGDNVSLHKLKDFTISSIVESLFVEKIINKNDAFYLYGGHQFNVVEYRDKIIVATDASDLNFNIFKIAQKSLKKVIHINV